MRISERVSYIVALAYLVLLALEQVETYLAFQIAQLLLIVAGCIYEGARMHQFPYYLGFILHTILI